MVKKIDFHIHTVASVKDYKFTYSSRWIQEYVEIANLDAIAITNHDLFDLDNFNKVKEDLPNTTVFPGIELSLEEGHVNVIFPEENIADLVKFSDWLASKNISEKSRITTEEYCYNMNNWENAIYIFELGKSNSLQVPNQLKNVCAVGGVMNQLKFQTYYRMENTLTPVLFSDAHADYNDPEDKRRNIELLKNKNTFLQLDNCSFQEIKNCISDRTKVAINSKNLRDIIEIGDHTVSTGLNLIIGKRGTGKTKFLERIKNQFDTEEIYQIAQFETAKSAEFIEKQRNEQGQSSFTTWKKQYNTQFTALQEYLKIADESYDSEIDMFLETVKQFAHETSISQSKSKYELIKESNFENISTNNLEKYLTELRKLINSHDLWSLLKNADARRDVFIEIYTELRILYIEKQEKNKIQDEVNKILDSVKKTVQSKTGITPVSDCEFSKILQKNQTEIEINKFMTKIICETELKRENIYGYQIIVNVVPYKDAAQFQKDFSINERVKDDLIDPYKKKDYIKFLKNLKNKGFFRNSNLADYFLHTEVKLLDADGTAASGGQAVGFALMMRLEEARTKPIVLIDEPEASLDNAYIREELINALKKLSDNSTVFVVTHNSTLGTLLEPDYLIVTTKTDEKDYHVLTGEFSSCVISKDTKISENSYEKFVEAMEAGIDTYNRKGEIYARLKN